MSDDRPRCPAGTGELAGFGTDHPGEGLCKLHTGSTTRGKRERMIQIQCDRCGATTASPPVQPKGWAVLKVIDHNNRTERWDLCESCKSVVRKCADTADPQVVSS